MRRGELRRGGLRLSYLDAGGEGPVLLALHAHCMEAVTYRPLAAALAPAWRVVALDQRGQGHSDRATSYRREDYLGDLLALLDHLGVARAVVLGNSLGGVNAMHLAARYPARVRALILEEAAAVIAQDAPFVLEWAGPFASRSELVARIGPRFLPYLQDSIRETPAGWRLSFDAHDMLASQRALVGDHRDVWQASRCPALVIRGRRSRFTVPAEIEEMAACRPSTRLVTLEAGHVVHADAPAAFTEVVRAFLDEVEARRA